MDGARLRKAFRYPDDSDDEPVDGIDEQEQETLIQTLTSQDAQTTNLYTNIFLGLPLICILPYLPSAYRFTSFLSITSLLLTAYYLYFVPLVPGAPRSQIAFLRSYNSGGDGSASRAWQAWRSYFDEDGPVNRWAGVLNGLLAGLVGLRGYVEGRKGGWTGTEGLWGVLPLVVYILIILVRSALRPVDVQELEKLRYRYKGA